MGLFNSRKATHIISAPAAKGSVDEKLGNAMSKAAVYGRKDLKRRLTAAKEDGVEVTVRKLKRNER